MTSSRAGSGRQSAASPERAQASSITKHIVEAVAERARLGDPVRGLIDLLVFIDTPFEELASRLIDRHMSFGRDRADAAHWVRTVDAANMALVDRTKERADLVLSL